MSLLDSPVEIRKNSIQFSMETEFCEFSPELEDHFEIFEHIQGFDVTIVTSANTQDETLPPWSSFLQKDEGETQAAAALMMGADDLHEFERSRLERNDFSMNGSVGMVNPASRQIYLTFPADSTFKEEDVSNYFSIYGPVQDVRILYQQKRMFGFVTFVYLETVKLILAKENPHFVCDAGVLVKP
ncbi:hypothetical protein FEM48_Zijuj03G0076800 [Ziziphus jujuba var. spinosa]|uniref:RRM domain-containing protein n=1 Tax=Ziziphus jujuba var. spinosa TaxID=714518 RepID=A0A978VP13_ZIZJJ|nr:hypothetical protein FEM48_Zijuj03G0076800 [Ziziphus jujuba var. spinosa]